MSAPGFEMSAEDEVRCGHCAGLLEVIRDDPDGGAHYEHTKTGEVACFADDWEDRVATPEAW